MKGGEMNKKIKVYTTSTCPYCKRLESFLTSNNVLFEEFEVGQDKNAREEMIKKSGQMGVPVIDIEGKIIVGFDKEALSIELGI